MPLEASQIEEADAEALYPLTIPVKLKGGAEAVINLRYREPTIERLTGNKASILSNLIAEWDVTEAPDYTYFSRRRLEYLEKLLEAITEDFNPSEKKG